MIIELEEAKDMLRVSFDDDDDIIRNLIEALPKYLLEKTGKDWDTKPIDPLVKTVSRFILMSWYDADYKGYEEFINYNLALLSTKARGENNNGDSKE